MSKIKMTPIRKSAKGKECTLRVSGYGGCSDPDTVVLCHAPCRDKGGAFKSPDWWGAYGCQKCHDLMDDRRKITDYLPGFVQDTGTGVALRQAREVQRHMTAAEKTEAWLRGIYETHKILIEEGLIEVAA